MTKVQELLIKNLKHTRGELGYSQMLLAEKAGISLGFLGDIEAGKKFPSAKTLQKLLDALGLAAYELFIDEEDCRLPRHHEFVTTMERELIERLHGQVNYVFDKHFLDKSQ